jgi:hypothetical protein
LTIFHYSEVVRLYQCASAAGAFGARGGGAGAAPRVSARAAARRTTEVYTARVTLSPHSLSRSIKYHAPVSVQNVLCTRSPSSKSLRSRTNELSLFYNRTRNTRSSGSKGPAPPTPCPTPPPPRGASAREPKRALELVVATMARWRHRVRAVPCDRLDVREAGLAALGDACLLRGAPAAHDVYAAHRDAYTHIA